MFFDLLIAESLKSSNYFGVSFYIITHFVCVDAVWVQYLVWYDDRHYDGDGLDGVLAAHSETSLGRVPK